MASRGEVLTILLEHSIKHRQTFLTQAVLKQMDDVFRLPDLFIVTAVLDKIRFTRNTDQFELASRLIEKVYETDYRICSFKLCSKLLLGLKMKFLLEYLRQNDSDVEKKLNIHLPNRRPDGDILVSKEWQDYQESVTSFHDLFFSLVRDRTSRDQYFEQEYELEYGDECMRCLFRLLNNFLVQLTSHLPQTKLEMLFARRYEIKDLHGNQELQRLLEFLRDKKILAEEDLVKFLDILDQETDRNSETVKQMFTAIKLPDSHTRELNLRTGQPNLIKENSSSRNQCVVTNEKPTAVIKTKLEDNNTNSQRDKNLRNVTEMGAKMSPVDSIDYTENHKTQVLKKIHHHKNTDHISHKNDVPCLKRKSETRKVEDNYNLRLVGGDKHKSNKSKHSKRKRVVAKSKQSQRKSRRKTSNASRLWDECIKKDEISIKDTVCYRKKHQRRWNKRELNSNGRLNSYANNLEGKIKTTTKVKGHVKTKRQSGNGNSELMMGKMETDDKNNSGFLKFKKKRHLRGQHDKSCQKHDNKNSAGKKLRQSKAMKKNTSEFEDIRNGQDEPKYMYEEYNPDDMKVSPVIGKTQVQNESNISERKKKQLEIKEVQPKAKRSFLNASRLWDDYARKTKHSGLGLEELHPRNIPALGMETVPEDRAPSNRTVLSPNTGHTDASSRKESMLSPVYPEDSDHFSRTVHIYDDSLELPIIPPSETDTESDIELMDFEDEVGFGDVSQPDSCIPSLEKFRIMPSVKLCIVKLFGKQGGIYS